MGINATKYRDRYIKRAARVLPAIQPGVPFTPEAIDKIVGGEYSSKFVFYLRELGFEFSQAKDGRKIVSYTLIKEPADAATIRGATASAARGAAKAPKAKTVSKALGLTKTEANKIRAEVKAEKASKATKLVELGPITPTEAKKLVAERAEDIKAANLAKLKEVGANRAKVAKKVREYDDVTEQFGNNGEVATSFSIDRDWDSVEGLDLSKLI